ncbi:DUF4383 domain-containing protein [Lentzea sp. NBRC 102530]|uniref:DUF4383 domain-containing protein n=1 Tax=Lentzea sp. NBRC 102530 TaxID=3032201 RepID=UPI0024A23CE2|nr:DUF4383 domain-containing protein [Lentzea sp. NBRC 102530]GLY47827.1 membrane protein [Lentzea sp. NBRC 102530]
MARTETDERRAVQKIALVASAVFALVGIAGFVPGLTTNHDGLMFAGHESHAMLLGVFAVSVLHNIVHLAFAVVGFLMSRTVDGAHRFLIGGGAVYLVLFVYGLVFGHSTDLNFVPVNPADNWLHLFLGAGMIFLGRAAGRGHGTHRR